MTGGEKAGNALIQRYSDMDAVIGYNDPSAVGAVIAARAAGRKLTVIGLNGTSDGIAAVKDGRLAATVQGDSPGIGRETVKAAYLFATKQGGTLAESRDPPAEDRHEGERQLDTELERRDQGDQVTRSIRRPGPPARAGDLPLT